MVFVDEGEDAVGDGGGGVFGGGFDEIVVKVEVNFVSDGGVVIDGCVGGG